MPLSGALGLGSLRYQRNGPITRNETGSSNLVNISDVNELWKQLEPWKRELIARRWAKRTNRYYGDVGTLQTRWFHKLLSSCRQPAGRADGQLGSQKYVFEMDLPTHMCLKHLGLGVGADLAAGFEVHHKAKYAMSDTTGNIKWKRSSSIDTFYINDKDAVADYLKFETRPAASRLAAFGCSKGVVRRETGIKVVCSVIPSLIVELCHRSHGRLVLAVTCNLLTFNDQDALDLPPFFNYTEGERASFRCMALEHLQGIAKNKPQTLAPHAQLAASCVSR
eukprot:5013708-Pleurochrysis_carterae.AAC.3